MDPVALFLLTVAGIFAVGTLGEIIFRRTGVPDVVWLAAIGILLGPVSGVLTRDALTAVAPYFAALTLVIVLFEGGSQLKLEDVKRVAPRSALLALVTFVTAVGVVAVISMVARGLGLMPAGWTWSHGFLLGAILGGSSSIIIMPAMTQAEVVAKVSNLVGLESAFTDALCVVVASAMIDMMVPGGAGSSPAVALLRSFGLGLGLGAGAGLLWLLALRFLKAHAYPMTLAALFALYVAIAQVGGSAALGILTFAVIVGNARWIGPRLHMGSDLELGTDVRGAHSQIAFIIKSFFFTFIGAMLGPPWSLVLLGAGFGLLLLPARWLGVFLATLGRSFDASERHLVVVAGPRGMAAGVLATLPAAAGVPHTEALPAMVFSAVLLTVIAFAVRFPRANRRLTSTATRLAVSPAPRAAEPSAEG